MTNLACGLDPRSNQKLQFRAPAVEFDNHVTSDSSLVVCSRHGYLDNAVTMTTQVSVRLENYPYQSDWLDDSVAYDGQPVASMTG